MTITDRQKCEHRADYQSAIQPTASRRYLRNYAPFSFSNSLQVCPFDGHCCLPVSAPARWTRFDIAPQSTVEDLSGICLYPTR